MERLSYEVIFYISDGETFNIPIRDESDVDSFETKQDKDVLKN